MKNVTLLEKIKIRAALYFKIPYTFNKLMSANIEIIGNCNLHCRMCGFNDSRKRGLMSFALFQKTILELEKNGKPIIGLHQFGEPLLHPEIWKFIDFAKSRGFSIILYTNATLLDDKKIKMLKDHPVDGIRTSFIPDKEKYEYYWAGSKYENVANNLRKIIRISDDWTKKPKITINLLHSRNEDVSLYKKAAKKLFGNNKYFLETDEMSEFYGSDPDVAYTKKTGIISPCFESYFQTAILHNGDVVPCCADLNGYYVIGNIKKNSLKELRNNDRMVKLRKMLINQSNNLKICQNCPFCHHEENLFRSDIQKIKLSIQKKRTGRSND